MDQVDDEGRGRGAHGEILTIRPCGCPCKTRRDSSQVGHPGLRVRQRRLLSTTSLALGSADPSQQRNFEERSRFSCRRIPTVRGWQALQIAASGSRRLRRLPVLQACRVEGRPRFVFGHTEAFLAYESEVGGVRIRGAARVGELRRREPRRRSRRGGGESGTRRHGKSRTRGALSPARDITQELLRGPETEACDRRKPLKTNGVPNKRGAEPGRHHNIAD